MWHVCHEGIILFSTRYVLLISRKTDIMHETSKHTANEPKVSNEQPTSSTKQATANALPCVIILFKCV